MGMQTGLEGYDGGVVIRESVYVSDRIGRTVSGDGRQAVGKIEGSD